MAAAFSYKSKLHKQFRDFLSWGFLSSIKTPTCDLVNFSNHKIKTIFNSVLKILSLLKNFSLNSKVVEIQLYSGTFSYSFYSSKTNIRCWLHLLYMFSVQFPEVPSYIWKVNWSTLGLSKSIKWLMYDGWNWKVLSLILQLSNTNEPNTSITTFYGTENNLLQDKTGKPGVSAL